MLPMCALTVTRALSRLGLDQRGTDPHPRQPAPMLPQKAADMFSSANRTYEPKWDSFRVFATVRDGSVRLISRNGRTFTNLFKPVPDALRRLPDVDSPRWQGPHDAETTQKSW